MGFPSHLVPGPAWRRYHQGSICLHGRRKPLSGSHTGSLFPLFPHRTVGSPFDSVEARDDSILRSILFRIREQLFRQASVFVVWFSYIMNGIVGRIAQSTAMFQIILLNSVFFIWRNPLYPTAKEDLCVCVCVQRPACPLMLSDTHDSSLTGAGSWRPDWDLPKAEPWQRQTPLLPAYHNITNHTGMLTACWAWAR